MMGDGWGWIGGGLMMLIFWGGLIALVVFAARASVRARIKERASRARPTLKRSWPSASPEARSRRRSSRSENACSNEMHRSARGTARRWPGPRGRGFHAGLFTPVRTARAPRSGPRCALLCPRREPN